MSSVARFLSRPLFVLNFTFFPAALVIGYLVRRSSSLVHATSWALIILSVLSLVIALGNWNRVGIWTRTYLLGMSFYSILLGLLLRLD
jgi:hypothetical protein